MCHSARLPDILYIVRANQPWPFFEWICRQSHGRNFRYTFLLLHAGESPLAKPLREAGIPFEQLRIGSLARLPLVAWAVRRFCRTRKFDLVHTHFMDACLAGLAGAALAGIRLRVHTRHHSSFHPLSHRKRWELVFDRFNNRVSSTIIAPCEDVRRRLLEEGNSARKIHLIRHGFDLNAFRNVAPERVLELRAKYDIPEGPPVIGVMSRYVRPKGVEYVIEAFRRLRETYPFVRLVLANATGQWAARIKEQLNRLPPSSYREIPFEADAAALYRLFDLYVFVPVAPAVEGFGQTYIEALASGVPSIFTKAGIAHEIIKHKENAWVVDYQSAEGIHEGMKTLFDTPPLRECFIKKGGETVDPAFGLSAHVARLESLYRELIREEERPS